LVSKLTYHPDRGDLVEINFMPAAGREIDKRRPAVILTPLSYNRRGGLCVAVPITSNLTPGSLWLPMPAGYLPRPSLILCDCVKSIDYRERSATLIGRVPKELIEQIVSNILDLIDPLGSS
jgi:mRNA interferase MazF